MNILVANDDGIEAEGIYELAKSLSTKHNVTVVAPDSQRSAVSQSMAIFNPILARKVEFKDLDIDAYSISGMPSDCVKLGVYSLMKEKPDIVFSGINCGANFGTDTLYSGTVGAATEGALIGIKSVAISTNSMCPKHYKTAAEYALVLADWLEKNDLPDGNILNVNVPDLPIDEIKGVRYKTLGHFEYNSDYVPRMNPRDEMYFWHPTKPLQPEERKEQNDVDFQSCECGYIVITPLHWDRTNKELLDKLSSDDTLQWQKNSKGIDNDEG